MDAFFNSVYSLYSAPRIAQPVWLSMMTCSSQRGQLSSKFLEDFVSLTKKCDTKSSKLWVSDRFSWNYSAELIRVTFPSVLQHCWFGDRKVHTLDIAPLRSESPLQKRSGMARVLKGFHSFTCTPTHSSAIGMSHTCLCLPSCSWYSFTDPGGMEGWGRVRPACKKLGVALLVVTVWLELCTSYSSSCHHHFHHP